MTPSFQRNACDSPVAVVLQPTTSPWSLSAYGLVDCPPSVPRSITSYPGTGLGGGGDGGGRGGGTGLTTTVSLQEMDTPRTTAQAQIAYFTGWRFTGTTQVRVVMKPGENRAQTSGGLSPRETTQSSHAEGFPPRALESRRSAEYQNGAPPPHQDSSP